MLKHAVLLISTYIWRYTPSSGLVQTHANTRSTVHTNQQMQTNLQLLIKVKNASSCSSLQYKPINADTHSALCVCGYQPLYADTSTALDACRHKQMHNMTSPNACWCVLSADTRKALNTEDNNTALNERQSMQIHAQLRHGPSRASTCWALDSCRNLHLHTPGSRENTRKYMPSSWYRSTHMESWQNLQKRWDMHIHAQL